MKQASREWYEMLHSYLIKIEFVRKSENSNMNLISEAKEKVLIGEIFVDDIIFGGNDLL